jgi:hypothetical protein
MYLQPPLSERALTRTGAALVHRPVAFLWLPLRTAERGNTSLPNDEGSVIGQPVSTREQAGLCGTRRKPRGDCVSGRRSAQVRFVPDHSHNPPVTSCHETICAETRRSPMKPRRQAVGEAGLAPLCSGPRGPGPTQRPRRGAVAGDSCWIRRPPRLRRSPQQLRQANQVVLQERHARTTNRALRTKPSADRRWS